jgi:hypothetical protein
MSGGIDHDDEEPAELLARWVRLVDQAERQGLTKAIRLYAPRFLEQLERLRRQTRRALKAQQ